MYLHINSCLPRLMEDLPTSRGSICLTVGQLVCLYICLSVYHTHFTPKNVISIDTFGEIVGTLKSLHGQIYKNMCKLEVSINMFGSKS